MRFVRWAVLLAALSSCGDDSADQGEFVDYWADPTAVCAKLADDCELVARSECVDNWPGKPLVQRALDLAQLEAGDLTQCLQAARASDACFLDASCSELSSTQPLCEGEQQDVELECAKFIKALEFIEERGDIGDDPSDTDSGDGTYGERVCTRLLECSDEAVSEADLSDCSTRADESFASLLPDARDIAQCVADLDCADLVSDDTSAVRACLDIDPRTTHCMDDTLLHVCNSQGACRDIDCFGVCGAQPDGVALCKFAPDEGYDICDCEW
jgi:hypothetical protein